jgi:hypothetical protein
MRSAMEVGAGASSAISNGSRRRGKRGLCSDYHRMRRGREVLRRRNFEAKLVSNTDHFET